MRTHTNTHTHTHKQQTHMRTHTGVWPACELPRHCVDGSSADLIWGGHLLSQSILCQLCLVYTGLWLVYTFTLDSGRSIHLHWTLAGLYIYTGLWQVYTFTLESVRSIHLHWSVARP